MWSADWHKSWPLNPNIWRCTLKVRFAVERSLTKGTSTYLMHTVQFGSVAVLRWYTQTTDDPWSSL